MKGGEKHLLLRLLVQYLSSGSSVSRRDPTDACGEEAHGVPEKHTNISSTNQGHGLCYYYFFVEVKGSFLAA